MGAEDLCREENCRNHRERQQRKQPTHAQHDDDDEGEGEDVLEDGEDAGGEHLVEGVDVGGDASDQATHWIAVEEADVHALDVAEDLAAQIEHDLLSGPLHQVGLNEFETEGEQQRAEVEQSDLGHAANGVGAEMAGEPTQFFTGCRCEIGVDGYFDEVGAKDVAGGLDKDGDRGDSGLELIRLQVGEETPHEAAIVGFADDIIVYTWALRCGLLCLLRLFLFFGHLIHSIRCGSLNLRKRVHERIDA